MKTIDRQRLLAKVAARFRSDPVVLLLGPRQCGKTTLARRFAAGRHAEYFDLEAPADFDRLAQPMTALDPLRGLARNWRPRGLFLEHSGRSRIGPPGLP